MLDEYLNLQATMAHIKITKGLDIPFKKIDSLDIKLIHSQVKTISLGCSSFDDIKFRLLKKIGDSVKIGEPIAQDKQCPGRLFVSPAHGRITDVIRGLKRKILDIIIEVEEKEERTCFKPLDDTAGVENIIQRLLEGGAFAHIRKRPFDCLAHPEEKPKSIFVKALESNPLTPPVELQIKGFEDEFAFGLKILNQLCPNNIHLIYKKSSSDTLFSTIKDINLHTASGPHPIANPSLHIQAIDPILSSKDVIWTLNVIDVIVIGSLCLKGIYPIERTVAIGGSLTDDRQMGYYKLRMGYPIENILQEISLDNTVRCISGDPLTGIEQTKNGYLQFPHTVLSFLLENQTRTLLHFFRPGLKQYTATRAYLSGLFKTKKARVFSTNQHGEKRAFIDGSIYEKVMPLNIPTMELIKAVLSEDFELAVQLGLLEVVGEDFALPAFICPSKIEIPSIITEGLRQYAKEYLS